MKYVLRITTYRGIDWEATHYYGSIHPEGSELERVDMEHKVDALDTRYFSYREVKPGEMWPTSRYLTTQDVLAAALAWMKENHPDDTLEVRDETNGE